MASAQSKFETHVRRYHARTTNLKKALTKLSIVRNPERLDGIFKSPPDLVASTCPFASEEETYEWSYEIRDLAFSLRGLRHPQPPSASVQSHGLLTCKITEYFAPNRTLGVEGIVPVKTVDLNFIIDGSHSEGGQQHPLRACWHIDTHIDGDDAEGSAAAAADGGQGSANRDDNHAMHPRFHYQFGGRHLRPSGPSIRGVLMLDVPRVPIPPLDLNLALDFVVSNYIGSNWQTLRRDTQYAVPVRDSMRRIWAPYYHCLSGFFSNQHPTGRYAPQFHPDLIK